MRNVFICQTTGKITFGAGAGGKKTICYCLRIKVCKLLRGQAGDKVFLECPVKTERITLALFFFIHFFLDHLVAQEAGAFGKLDGQAFSREGFRKFKGEELAY